MTDRTKELRCDICGDPAMVSILKDAFGKSDQTGNFCAVHAPKHSAVHPFGAPLTSNQETNRDKVLRREVVKISDGRLREMQAQAISFEGIGDYEYHWHWAAIVNELIARRAEVERLTRDLAMQKMLEEAMTDCIQPREGQTFEERAEELIVTEVQHQRCSAVETTDYRAAYNRVATAARAVTAELQKIGDETGWVDGDETDRVYAWYEMLPLVEALNADIQQPSPEEPTRRHSRECSCTSCHYSKKFPQVKPHHATCGCFQCTSSPEKATAYRCPTTGVDCIRNCAPTRCAIAKTY